ncbi:Zn(II)2Cys6 transcription factor [Colletotrichum sojae]|uniref:Zn(II)2Cys6 transcription factor n=1 Tax=Colletotrichum sojae TaxID=2175907 RepID=A0A8H6MRQ3_9PEZI|nr:Zn(II)2Cys6 transcription factor [Colletotrichum sojae]
MPEIGSLRALSNGESQFVGSSSGVYFINTVRRAFSSASDVTPDNGARNKRLRNDPSPEDCIVGGDETPGVQGSSEAATAVPADERDPNPGPGEQFSPLSAGSDLVNDLSKLPDYSVARRLVLTYFRIWHPLVPFLQGPDCLAELDTLYTPNEFDRRDVAILSRLIIFRCIFNTARLDMDEKPDIGSAAIRSGSDLLPTLSLLALRSDACSIQALLSAQVYFISTMSLRHASSAGGLISKSIYQSGMHRCPVRYGHLSSDERSMRKRIFWSFYVLDRFVSQSLGHPNGIQDSDIDVCPPGRRDLHETVARSALSPSSVAADNTILHLPANHPDRVAASPGQRVDNPESLSEMEDDEPSAADAQGRSAAILRHRRETQAVLETHVRHSQLVGRILDVFHRSIHARDMNSQTILFLKADISAWGNDLTQPRLGSGFPDTIELTPDPRVFPFVTHQYTILLFNRPSLSLDSRCAEFRAALQTCIGAANVIIPTIEQYCEEGGPLFWPGYMSAVWMSGLVLALAARLKSYKPAKAKSGIHSALTLLTAMEKRWRMARDCKEVLSMLLHNIEEDKKGKGNKRDRTYEEPRSPTPARGNARSVAEHAIDGARTPKRRMVDTPRMEYRHPIDRQRSSQPGFPSHTMRTPLPSFSQRIPSNNFGFNTAVGLPHDEIAGFHRSMVDYGGLSPIMGQQNFGFMGSPGDFQSSSHNLTSYFAPIPTTFPDRHRSGTNPQADQVGGTDNFFDIFDGATWGSLIDIINDAGTGS